jgi:hypothetical protein
VSEQTYYLDFPKYIPKYIEEAAEEVKRNVKHIESIGVELEGGVSVRAVDIARNKLKRYGLEERFEWGSDGSVYVNKPWYIYDEWDENAELRFWVETHRIEILFDFVDTLWKYGFRQNSSCGNHVHLKFYNNLTTLSIIFNEKFVREFEKKYLMYARARGPKYLDRIKNNYCAYYKFYSFPAALYHYCRSRYHAVNFVSVDEQQTLEIRIMPYADSAEEYIENIVWLVKVVDNLVEKMKRSVKRVGIRIRLESTHMAREEEIIEEFEV